MITKLFNKWDGMIGIRAVLASCVSGVHVVLTY